MIEVSFLGFFLFASLISLASLAGTFVSSLPQWGDEARASGLPLAAGIAFGPFLLGLAAIAVLLALPGKPAAAHVAIIASALAAPALLGIKPLAANLRAAGLAQDRHLRLVTASAVGAAGLLVLLTIFTPLTQNDALEYEIVARRIFELRSLSSYPMIDPASEPSGFFAPWTHPPLYPVLLYVAQLAQGHADSPVLDRLIAPWALIAAAAVCAALARMEDRRAGGFAFLCLVSPPLVFLGAAGALIDSLTILGMALAMAFACAGSRGGFSAALFTGIALGAALWAHSQAILLLPVFAAALLLQSWRRVRRPGLQSLFVTVAAAVLVGGWPYLWNVQRFGAMASDAQALVAPDVLRWDSYFAIDRGISNVLSKVVYGPFKLFSAPEAYGLLFALAVAGAALMFCQLRRGAAAKAGFEPRDDRSEPALTAAVLAAIYLAGVCLSLALGFSDLVKNERYLLLVAPPAAILAALFLVWIAGKAAQMLRVTGASPRLSRTLAYSAICAGFLFQTSALTAYGLAKSGLLGPALGQPFETTLSQRAEPALAAYLRGNTPAGSLILSLKPADMYYAQRRMISQFDPRLKEFYSAQSLDGAEAALAGLGAAFVHLPNYAMPTFYNSWLKEILADPRRSVLLFENEAGQIYGLSPSRLAEDKRTAMGLESWPWEMAQGMVFGGRKRFGKMPGSFSPVPGASVTHEGLLVSAFERHAYAILRMGKDGAAKPAPAAPNTEYVAQFMFSGRCHIALLQYESTPGGEGAEQEGRLLATAIVESQTSPLSLPVRFRTGPQAHGLWFELLLSGGCALDVEKAELLQLGAK